MTKSKKKPPKTNPPNKPRFVPHNGECDCSMQYTDAGSNDPHDASCRGWFFQREGLHGLKEIPHTCMPPKKRFDRIVDLRAEDAESEHWCHALITTIGDARTLILYEKDSW